MQSRRRSCSGDCGSQKEWLALQFKLPQSVSYEFNVCARLDERKPEDRVRQVATEMVEEVGIAAQE